MEWGELLPQSGAHIAHGHAVLVRDDRAPRGELRDEDERANTRQRRGLVLLRERQVAVAGFLVEAARHAWSHQSVHFPLPRGEGDAPVERLKMRWKSVAPLCAMMGFRSSSVSSRYKSVCESTGPSSVLVSTCVPR